MPQSYLATLAKAFTDLHGCEARHVETVPVIECLEGKTVWRGEVEVFDLIGHPEARRGYAWSYDKKSESETVAVLGLPPVSSPLTAVHAARVGLTKSKKKGSRTGDLYKRYFRSKEASGDLHSKPC
ncbi:MAG: hypothetical protein LV481_00150 [Methylacidiphilales bacterium]|nr:hypothetical protein [Candidatus Methylacidiphilales bacterium]